MSQRDKSESKSTALLSEQFPIQVLCNFINTYSGERDTLPAFLTNCKNALDLASESQKELLLKFIVSKLDGKAQIACSNKVFDTFEDLKNFLKQNFGERKHYNHLLLDLQSCKHQPNETVAQYALRIETCLTSLQSEIHNSDSLKKELAGRIAMTEDLALYTFTLGLQSNIGNIVRCRDPKTLNAAINIAIEEEKILNLAKNTSVKSKYCKNCNKIGQVESECYGKLKRDMQRSQFQVHSRPQNNNYNYKLQNANTTVTCRYCKNVGHDISQCRKRQYNNSRLFNNNHPSGSRAYQQNCIESASETSSPPQVQEIENGDCLN